MSREAIGVYLHVPFCESRCSYCDFLTFPHAEKLHEPYVMSLCEEIAQDSERRGLRGVPADSVYVGGGTPSLLLPDMWDRLGEALFSSVELVEGAEITAEVNPGTLDDEKLRAMRRFGINRISLGVQSFNDRLLALCGRTHRRETVLRDIERLRDFGFDNLSLDLICSIPMETEHDVEEDLRALAEIRPEHVSWYSLIVEEKTLFEYKMRKGLLPEPDPEEDRRSFHRVLRGLGDLGYRRYEISNFARPGYESAHNLKYWTAKPYWGLGLGSASYLGRERYSNVRTFREYNRALEEGRPVWVREERDASDDAFEHWMMGLRLTEGIDRGEFQRLHGFDPVLRCRETAERARELGELEWDERRVRMTEQGLDVQNAFLTDWLIEYERTGEN